MRLLIFLHVLVITYTGTIGFPLVDNYNDDCDHICQEYLIKYGYVNLPSEHNIKTLNIKKGLINLQKDAGIEVTGKLDKNTLKLFNTPRCGVRYESSLQHRSKRFVALKAFNTLKNIHNETVIKWFIHPYNISIDQWQVQSAFNHAFKMWANTSLLFPISVDNEEDANVLIKFASEDHGDGFPFDGPGNVLAHAFHPGSSLNGQVHLDLDENWSIYGENDTISLLHVAIHELGHALGLGHSSQNKSIMYAWYKPSNFKLDEDDILAINSLYGVRPQYRFGPIGRYYPKTERTPTTSRPTTTTTKRTTTTTSKRTTKRYNLDLFKKIIIENSKVSMFLKTI